MAQTIEAILEKYGTYSAITVGYSMWPMLRNRIDTVTIGRIEDEVRRYDVVLYKKKEHHYVLHRVLQSDNGLNIICGDHNYKCEKVSSDEIVGILQGFYRKNHYIDVHNRGYLIYVHLWCDFFVIRVLILRIVFYLKKMIRFIKNKVVSRKR